jgi:hypothetical protein
MDSNVQGLKTKERDSPFILAPLRHNKEISSTVNKLTKNFNFIEPKRNRYSLLQLFY